MTQLTRREYGHEARDDHYCRGFVDRHGQWNNGFRCPRQPKHARHCCGPPRRRFCCAPTSNHVMTDYMTEAPRGLLDSPDGLVTMVGFIGVCLILISVAVVVVCCLWRCRRRKCKLNKTSDNSLPACSKGEKCVLYSRQVHSCLCRHGHLLFQNPDVKRPCSAYSEEPPPYDTVLLMNRFSLEPHYGDREESTAHAPPADDFSASQLSAARATDAPGTGTSDAIAANAGERVTDMESCI